MDYEVKIKEYKPRRAASIRVKTTLPQVSSKVVQPLTETSDFLESAGIERAGPGFAIYYEVGSFLVDLEVGYPVDAEITESDRVKQSELPGGKAAVTLHKGPHAEMPAAHRAVHGWMNEHGVESTGGPTIEIFLTDLRGLAEGEDCEAESVWPAVVVTRADRRRQKRAT